MPHPNKKCRSISTAAFASCADVQMRRKPGTSTHLHNFSVSKFELRIIFERFWQEILRFSRRTESQINHWAARYGYKDRGEEILKEAKHGANGRYACINLTNTDTIEFRVFRGTLKYNTVIATLQFVANLCRVAISLQEYRIQEFSWPALIEALTQDNCPELVQYQKNGTCMSMSRSRQKERFNLCVDCLDLVTCSTV